MKTRRIEKMEDLADLLIARGLVVSSREDLLGVLKIVGYYRLTGFLYPYRANDGTENFRPGTSLAEIWRLYTFDRRLRELAFQHQPDRGRIAGDDHQVSGRTLYG